MTKQLKSRASEKVEGIKTQHLHALGQEAEDFVFELLNILGLKPYAPPADSISNVSWKIDLFAEADGVLLGIQVKFGRGKRDSEPNLPLYWRRELELLNVLFVPLTVCVTNVNELPERAARELEALLTNYAYPGATLVL